jgi:maltose alpha-D-glucosyltransferase/alpha-amylase
VLRGHEVNVREQTRDRDSFLNWMERVIRTRRACREFGWGDCETLNSGDASVFAHRCTREQGGVAIAVHNLSDRARTVALDLSEHQGEELVDLLGDEDVETIREAPHDVHLAKYGYRWYRIDRGNRVSGGVLK